MKTILILATLIILASCKTQECRHVHFSFSEHDVNKIDMRRVYWLGDELDNTIEDWWRAKSNCMNSNQYEVDSIERKLMKYLKD